MADVVSRKRRPRVAAWRVAAAAILLGGCGTIAAARLAQDPASAVPGERTPTAAELGVATSGPLSLDDAIDVALRVHPTVLRTRHESEAAEYRVFEAESAFQPDVSVNASATYKNASPLTARTSTEKHRFVSSGFQVSWLLFDFDHAASLARKAAEDFLAAQANERAAAADVVFGVRSAYYTLVKDIQLRDVAREAVRQFQEHLDQVREFVRVGTRIPYDESKAEVDLGNAQQLLVTTEDAVLADQATLANAMGLAETADWTPAADATMPTPPASFDAAVVAARAMRPALAAAAARERAASALIDAQVAALYPELSFGLGFTASGSQTPLPWSWQLGPSVSWTPFDGFRNLYTVDEAVAAIGSARADRALAEQTSWLDVRSAWLAINDAQRRLELAALIVRSAQDNVTLAQGRFDVRLGTTVELTDAQQALIKARSDEVQARADHDLSIARLWKAIGAQDASAPAAAPGAPGRQP